MYISGIYDAVQIDNGNNALHMIKPSGVSFKKLLNETSSTCAQSQCNHLSDIDNFNRYLTRILWKNMLETSGVNFSDQIIVNAMIIDSITSVVAEKCDIEYVESSPNSIHH
ncbi:hypothetical protein [Rickettsia endosymbiont of Cardiosporidium cionae]|uniref:hypothetical protein n=1 Tax=Rickettsia endosymbiont of Cardiosporidium cionae TaxID=2777155 RepID=UPI0018962AA5|nr:hypothetical protein [Rickettsia endosymbiont of Cardiosporidium cionae]KAF8818567.1 hypothetical protein IHI24_000284 [Rickettsia endosymbiont of Cardiosporidium cionae]